MRRLPLVDVDRDGVAWLRSGECNRCGECCRSGDPFGGAMGAPLVAGACPYLVAVPGMHFCRDRSPANAYYTNGCAKWPSLPAHITDYPSCSYVFTRIEVTEG